MTIRHIKTETYRRFTLRRGYNKRIATLRFNRHWRAKSERYYVRNYGTLFSVRFRSVEFHYFKDWNR